METEMNKGGFVDILGFNGYQVNDIGVVRSFRIYKSYDSIRKHGCKIGIKILKQRDDKDGYKIVGLYVKGVVKFCKVHRIVAEAFIPNPHNLPCINHKDEIKFNNVVNNLEWCTVLKNNWHSKDKQQYKLTVDLANKIRDRYKSGGVSTYQLANEHGVTQTSIMQILQNKSYNEYPIL